MATATTDVDGASHRTTATASGGGETPSPPTDDSDGPARGPVYDDGTGGALSFKTTPVTDNAVAV